MNPRADSVVDNLIAYQDELDDEPIHEAILQAQSQTKENFDPLNISAAVVDVEDSKTTPKADGNESKSDSDALLYVSNEIFDKMISNANNSEENEDVYVSCQEVETRDGRMLMMATESEDSAKKQFQSPLEACLDYKVLSPKGVLEPAAKLVNEESNCDEQESSTMDLDQFDDIFDPVDKCCFMCYEKFKDITSFRVHFYSMHTKSKGDSTLYCVECKVDFKDVAACRIHFNNKHKKNDGETVLHCWECKMDFKKAKEYVVHKEKFHSEADNVCVVCGELLATSRSLQIHLHNHLNKQTYRCNTCGRVFGSHESRQDHIRNKHLKPNNSAIMCKHCGAHFQHGRSLVRHVNCVHAKQRVVCPTCNKSYSSISSLYYHQRTIHEKVAFHCGYCSKAFRSVSAIKKHENEMHYHPGKYRETPTEKTYNYNQFVTHHLENVRKKENPTLHIRCMFCKAEYFDHEAYAKHYSKFHSDENVDIHVSSSSDSNMTIPLMSTETPESLDISSD